MGSLLPISRGEQMPFIRAERRTGWSPWWALKSSPPPAFLTILQRRSLTDPDIQSRVRRQVLKRLPWTWERKRKRKA